VEAPQLRGRRNSVALNRGQRHVVDHGLPQLRDLLRHRTSCRLDRKKIFSGVQRTALLSRFLVAMSVTEADGISSAMSQAESAFVAVTPAAGPTSPNERIDALDVLRGLALFGVLSINVITEFRVSIFEQFLPSSTPRGALDRTVENILIFAFSLKALAVFSLLFGVGLAIQFERLRANPRRTSLLLRRLAVLLAFGLTHLFLIWNGDILTEYAVAGFLVFPFLFGPQWLLATAAVIFFGLYLSMPLLPSLVPFPAASRMVQHIEQARNIYGSGSFGEVLAFRIREVSDIFVLHFSIFPRTVALFLFGALAWRSGAVCKPRANKRLLFGIGAAALVLGVCFSIAASGKAPVGWAFLQPWYLIVERSAPVLMSVGYSAIVLAVMTTDARRMFAWTAPLGRMAFTNYLLQSFILGWIFYVYGLGLFGRVGVTAAVAIGAVLYVCQVLFSICWLRHYRFGPVEWLWRVLMYGEAQPMRLSGTFDPC